MLTPGRSQQTPVNHLQKSGRSPQTEGSLASPAPAQAGMSASHSLNLPAEPLNHASACAPKESIKEHMSLHYYKMRFIESLSAASAILAIASASPVDKRAIKKNFTLHQSVPKSKIRSGPASVAATYLKYGKQPPANVEAAAAGNDGSVTTTPTEYDSQYLTPVTIGGQELTLDFDTGSSDLWVFSTETPSNEVMGQAVYDPSKSDTAQRIEGATWSITYGDGSSSSGIVYTDTVTVGQTSFAGQAVELAQEVSTQFQQDAANDGLLGLAFDSLNTVKPTKQKTFFTNVSPSLSAPLFTVDLKKGAPGTFDFGFVDDSKHTGEVSYVDVDNSRGFWTFTSSGYSVGEGSLSASPIEGIADTGTTLLYLPDDVVDVYYGAVAGAKNDQQQGGFTYPCSADLPAISFGIGGYTAVVPGSYVNYAPVDESGTTCFGGIQSSNGIGINIFGDIFLKSQFVVFQGGDNPQLGFAAKQT
ncbi:MAG: hypothetical protein Q9201_002304 [Fulgogasparrea decipioides]